MVAMTRSLGLALIVGLTLAACSGDDDGTEPTGTDLSGNYTLTSYQVSGITLAPPAVTGALALTQTRYKINLTISVPVPTLVVDSGTYTVSGNQITQTSDVNPIQTVGTWTQTGNLFTIDVTVPVQGRIISSWQKQ
jgi:hypothetical protein